MIRPPNLAEAYPAEYAAYVRERTQDEEFTGGVLFADPRDPGQALGRQGDENYPHSVLIGRTGNGRHIVLTYAPAAAYAPDSWHYGITGTAEWDVIHRFPEMSALVTFLRNHVA